MNEFNRIIFNPFVQGFKEHPDRHYSLAKTADRKKDRFLSWAVDVGTEFRRGQFKNGFSTFIGGISNGADNATDTLKQRADSVALKLFEGMSESPWEDVCFPSEMTSKNYTVHQSRHYHMGRQVKDTCYYVKHHWPKILAWTALVYLSTKTAPILFGATTAISLVACSLPALVDDILGYRDSHKAAAQIKLNHLRERSFSKLKPFVVPLGVLAAVALYSMKFRGFVMPQEAAIANALFTGIVAGAWLSKGMLAFVETSRKRPSFPSS